MLGIAGLGVGYILGEARAQTVWFRTQTAEVSGVLSSHAQALCAIRLGDFEGAARILETLLDNAAVTLPQGKRFAELEEPARRAMSAAKVYRTAYPAAVPTPEVAEALAGVPWPAFKFCSNPEGCPLDRVCEQVRTK
jgi:hypothetical protein